MGEWIELSRQDAIDGWLKRYVERDPDDFPPDARAFVRRLDDGLQELRIQYADGTEAIIRDLRGDESPTELRVITERLIDIDGDDESSL